jgi:hypothetical protein
MPWTLRNETRSITAITRNVMGIRFCISADCSRSVIAMSGSPAIQKSTPRSRNCSVSARTILPISHDWRPSKKSSTTSAAC